MRLNIKPLSVNKAWQGRRFKTQAYKDYEKECLSLLKRCKVELFDKMEIRLTVGYSNKLSDIDNFLKPALDVLQIHTGMNDRNIYRLSVEKVITKKGQEFIDFEISEYVV
jgi:Holliday junction resolvase RusA-like endonuclease